MQLVHILFPLLFTIIIFIILLTVEIKDKHFDIGVFSICLIYLIPTLVINSLFMFAIEKNAGVDTEIWSGRIIEIDHNEEWDEWIPPKTYTETEYYYVNGEKKSRQVTKTKPGYWKHHYATNSIKTSDEGWKNVGKSPDGKVDFNDKYPNTNEELAQYYPLNQATASFHTYQNKLQFSKSLFKAGDVDETLVEQLPNYPDKVNSDFSIDRFLGQIQDKEKMNNLIDEWNAKLNSDPLNKQVNVIYVNVGDLPIEYGYALEAKWEGANKNDFVICFSMIDNKINWVYPFSWTEIEILKINIRDYMLDNKNVDDFSTIINDTCNMIAKDFTRKEMADYEYIKYQHKTGSYVISFIVCAIVLGVLIYILNNIDINSNNYYNRRY